MSKLEIYFAKYEDSSLFLSFPVPQMFYYINRTLVLSDAGALNELYEFDPLSITWRERTKYSQGAVSKYNMAFHSVDGILVVFGGMNNDSGA